MATKTRRETRDAAEEVENDDLVIVSAKEDNCTTTMGAYSGDPQSKVMCHDYEVKYDEPYMTKHEQLIPTDGFLVVTLDNKYSLLRSKEVEFHVTDRRDGTALFPEMKSTEKNYDLWGTMMRGKIQMYFLDHQAFAKSEEKGGFKISVGAKCEAKFSIRVSAGQKIVMTASVARHDIKINASYQIDAFQVLEAMKQQKRDIQHSKDSAKEMQNEKRELLKTKRDLLKTNHLLTEEVGAAKKAAMAQTEKIAQANSEIKRKDTEIHSLKDAKESLELKVQSFSSRTKSLDSTLASERAMQSAKEAKLRSEIKSMEDALASERAEHRAKEARLISEMKSMEDTIGRERDAYLELRKEMKRKTEEASVVAANLNTSRAQLKEMQDHFEHARTSLASLIQRHTSAGEKSLHTMWQRAGVVHRVVLWIDTSSASNVTELIQKAQMKGVTVVQMRTFDAAQKYLSSETGKVLLRSPDVAVRAVFCNPQPKNERKTAMEAVRFASDLRDREISIPVLIYSRSSDVMHTAHSLVKESDIVNVLLTRDLARCSDFLTFEDKTLEAVSSSSTKSNDDDDEDDDTSKAVSNWKKALDMLASMGFKNQHMCLELLEKHTTNSPNATLEERVSAVATRMCDFATGRGIEP